MSGRNNFDFMSKMSVFCVTELYLGEQFNKLAVTAVIFMFRH